MRRAALLLFLLALYLPALGNSSSGSHPDEAWYLGISAEMQAKGAWLTPSLDDVLNWNKAPLLYWAERAAYTVFGTNLFAARLPSALAWIAAMLLSTRWAGACTARRREWSPRCSPPPPSAG